MRLTTLARGGASILLGAALLLPLGLALPRVGVPTGLQVGTVDGHSMDGTYTVSDVVFTHTQPIRVGDIVRVNLGDEKPYVHRVIGVTPAHGAAPARYITKGDGNESEDVHDPAATEIDGVVVLHLAGAQADAWRLSTTWPARAAIAIAAVLLWPTSTRRTRQLSRPTPNPRASRTERPVPGRDEGAAGADGPVAVRRRPTLGLTGSPDDDPRAQWAGGRGLSARRLHGAVVPDRKLAR